MNKINGYRNFSFGDIIKFTDKDIDKRLKNKDFKFIKTDGEDYLLYDIKDKDIITVRAYYFNKFVKIKKEEKEIITWEISYDNIL